MVVNGDIASASVRSGGLLKQVEHQKRGLKPFFHPEIQPVEIIIESILSYYVSLEMVDYILPVILVHFELQTGVYRVSIYVRGIYHLSIVVIRICRIGNVSSRFYSVENRLEKFLVYHFGRSPFLGKRDMVFFLYART